MITKEKKVEILLNILEKINLKDQSDELKISRHIVNKYIKKFQNKLGELENLTDDKDRSIMLEIIKVMTNVASRARWYTPCDFA